MKKTIAGLAFAAGCAILMSGCEKEKLDSSAVMNTGAIRVTANANNVTKAVAVTTTMLEESAGFVLDAWTNDSWYDLSTESGHIGEPTGDLHDQASDYHYINSGGDANVFYSSTPITYTPSSRDGSDETAGWYIYDSNGYEHYNWITGKKAGDYEFRLSFWARYPQDDDVNGTLVVTDPAINATTEDFTYTLPTASAGSDATNQQDILFAYAAVSQEHDQAGNPLPYSIFPKPAETNTIDLTFNHALSMVNFCVSPDDATFDISLRINSIEITNVPKGGACTFNGKGTIAGKNMFVWNTSTYALGSYSQTYNASFESPSSATGWKISEYGSATPKKHVYTCSNAFMLIPHKPYYSGTPDALTNAQITIEFFDMDAGATITKTIDLNKDGDVWLPGYYYTYKIKATKVGSNIYPAVYLTAWDDITSTHYIY